MKNIFLIAACLPWLSAAAMELHSPDGRIIAKLKNDSTSSIDVCYRNAENSSHLFSISSIGATTADGVQAHAGMNATLTCKDKQISYTMLSGKRRECSNIYNEYTLAAHGQNVVLTMRLYNDGVAFRYESPKSDTITGELTRYRIAPECKRWMQQYDPSYERFFPEETGLAQPDKHWGYPALFEFGNDTYGLFTEAGIEKGHSASSLSAIGLPSEYAVSWGGDAACQATPWRLAVIGSLGQIVESTLVTDISPDSRISDTSWIKPGVASWIYWAYNRGSKDYQLVKQYIDMAAALKLPYVLIDWEWDVMENGGNIDDAIAYAADKGIKVLLWYNSSTAWTTNGAGGPLFKLNKAEDREREFAMLHDKGVAGVKIDFFSGDTRETMDYCIELLESAARHNLLVNFHGATVPRGWQRTYPNLVSVEGVYGAEWYNNAPVLTDKAACHNATLPFTRNVIGPMDYTPCTFSDSQHPHITTHGHELALTALFESSVQHLADKPESYHAQPAEVQNLFGTLPTVWDETRLISGYPGHHAVIARRSGNRWFIAGINGTDSPLNVNLDTALIHKDSTTDATLFTDSGDSANPWLIHKVKSIPQNIDMKPRGGFLIVL